MNYIAESPKGYLEISTEKTAYNVGGRSSSQTNSLISYIKDKFVENDLFKYLNDNSLSEEQKSSTLRKWGLEFRVNQIIVPQLNNVHENINNIDNQMREMESKNSSDKLNFNPQYQELRYNRGIQSKSKDKLENEKESITNKLNEK